MVYGGSWLLLWDTITLALLPKVMWNLQVSRPSTTTLDGLVGLADILHRVDVELDIQGPVLGDAGVQDLEAPHDVHGRAVGQDDVDAGAVAGGKTLRTLREIS